MRKFRLRTKFLLSLLAVSAGLTAATLAIVSYSVQKRVRESLREDLRNSVKTYQTFEYQREVTLAKSAELLANLPTVRALMTTNDVATIQDESANIWQLSGSDLLVLANRSGNVVGLRVAAAQFSQENAQELLHKSMQRGEEKAWWFGGGHLYEVCLQPIYFGPSEQGAMMGVLAVGHEIDDRTAKDFGNVVSSDVVFRYSGKVVATTFVNTGSDGFESLQNTLPKNALNTPQEVQLNGERYLTSSVVLSGEGEPAVTLHVFKSFDKATAFLDRLNRVLLAVGLLSVLAGGVLVFLISHTFTRPLSNLVEGVRALEAGNFEYPLDQAGGDEVAQVTGAFDRMRTTLQATQTEQKQLEERLRQAHKMEAVGRLAGGVAHDFNNLLTVIRGNSDILADRDRVDNLQKRCIEQIQKASDRAVSMTRQLLAFSRMQVLQPRVLDLNAVISEMEKMLPRLIGEHIEFSFVPEPKLATVLADPGQMEQVLLNLAVNARDAMPDGGKLKITTANVLMDEAEAGKRPPMAAGKYVSLSVTDTGCGMDAVTKAHIFEPFFTTKEIGKGTGLGLATVYGIVKQSGGFIWVESSPGRGTCFEIYLPFSTKSAADVEQETKSASLRHGTETVLVVEDETGVRELASEFLRNGGYTVLQAKNGLEALEISREHKGAIHLLLSDLVMPKMGGKELASRLKLLIPDVRVMFMTGYAGFSSDGEEAMPGREVVLQKPFSRISLLKKVEEVLMARSSERLTNSEANQTF